MGSLQWEIDYNASAGGLNFTDDYVGSSFVTITAVPEPSTLVLIGIGLAGLRLARRCKWDRLSLGTQDGAFPRRTIANCTSGRGFLNREIRPPHPPAKSACRPSGR